MYLRRGLIFLAFLLVLPIVYSFEFQCEDGTLFGQCNDKSQICANGVNLIHRDKVNLNEQGRYLFFAETNENCNDYELRINDNIRLAKIRDKIVGEFNLTQSYNGNLSVFCDGSELKTNKKYLGKIEGEVSLYSDFSYCGITEEFINLAQRYLNADEDEREDLREEMREKFGLRSSFFTRITGRAIVENKCADFTGNNLVDFDDFFLFADNFGMTNEDEGFDEKFDLDNDGFVSLEDFFLFADEFGDEVECVKANCVDSDGGRNDFEKGIASTPRYTSIDECTSSNRLLEQFCRTSDAYSSEGYFVDCEYGCRDGFCCIDKDCTNQRSEEYLGEIIYNQMEIVNNKFSSISNKLFSCFKYTGEDIDNILNKFYLAQLDVGELTISGLNGETNINLLDGECKQYLEFDISEENIRKFTESENLEDVNFKINFIIGDRDKVISNKIADKIFIVESSIDVSKLYEYDIGIVQIIPLGYDLYNEFLRQHNIADLVYFDGDYQLIDNKRVYSLKYVGNYWEDLLKKHGIVDTELGKNPKFNIHFIEPIEKEGVLIEGSRIVAVPKFFDEALRQNNINTYLYDFVINIQYQPTFGYNFERAFAIGRNSYIPFNIFSIDKFTESYTTIVHELGHQLFGAGDLYDGYGQRYPQGVPDPLHFPQDSACLMSNQRKGLLRFSNNLVQSFENTEAPENLVLCVDTISRIGVINPECSLQDFYSGLCGDCNSLNYLSCKKGINTCNYLLDEQCDSLIVDSPHGFLLKNLFFDSNKKSITSCFSYEGGNLEDTSYWTEFFIREPMLYYLDNKNLLTSFNSDNLECSEFGLNVDIVKYLLSHFSDNVPLELRIKIGDSYESSDLVYQEKTEFKIDIPKIQFDGNFDISVSDYSETNLASFDKLSLCLNYGGNSETIYNKEYKLKVSIPDTSITFITFESQGRFSSYNVNDITCKGFFVYVPINLKEEILESYSNGIVPIEISLNVKNDFSQYELVYETFTEFELI